MTLDLAESVAFPVAPVSPHRRTTTMWCWIAPAGAAWPSVVVVHTMPLMMMMVA